MTTNATTRTQEGAEHRVPTTTSHRAVDRGALVLVGGALLVRVAFLLPGFGDPDLLITADAEEYIAVATDLRGAYGAGDGPVWELGLERTPVYPVLLAPWFALAGSGSAWALVPQILVSVAAVWLTYRLGTLLIGRRAGLIAGAIVALDPTSISYAGTFQPETLFTALLVAGTLCWANALLHRSAPWLLATGATFGIAALARPIALFLPVVVVPASALLIRGSLRARLVPAAVVLVAFAVPTGAWITRNAATTGTPTMSTVQGRSLLSYRAAGALAEDEGIGMPEARRELQRRFLERRSPGMNPAEESQLMTTLGLEVLLDHPRGAFIAGSKGALRMLGGPGRNTLLRRIGDETPDTDDTPAEHAVVWGSIAFLLVVYGAAGFGVVTMWRADARAPLVIPLVIIAYFVLMSAGPEAYARFRVPIVPFLAILAGAGIARFVRSTQATRNTSSPPPHTERGLPHGT